MFLSVVIPMLNAEPYLRRCLDALGAQDYPREDYEVILVDNGSIDQSVRIAREYAWLTVLEEPRRGAYNARNTGVAAARGEILVFTDSDCFAAPDWLSALARALSDPATDLVCGRRLPWGGSSLVRMLAEYEVTKDACVLGGDDEEIIYGFSSNLAVRRALFDRVGPFLDLERGADTLFVRAVARERSARAVGFASDAAVTHLELDNLRTYYKKVFLYGRHRRRNNVILRSRPLNNAERLNIYRRTIREHGYSRIRSATLLGLLALGSVVWSAGSLSGRFIGSPARPLSANPA